MDNIFKDSNDQLFDALAETFEALTFASVDPWEDQLPLLTLKDIPFMGSIKINLQEINYNLHLAIAESYLYELLENSYPDKDSFNESDKNDFVGEITNTLTGNYMLRMEKKTGSFHLSLPQCYPNKLPQDSAILTVDAVIDDTHPVKVYITNS